MGCNSFGYRHHFSNTNKMRKLLLATGCKQPESATLDFACYLAKMTSSKLTGVFMEILKHKDILVTSLQDDVLQMDIKTDSSMPENEAARSHCEQMIRQFKNACISRETTVAVHRDRGVPWDELIMECRYADAIITDINFTLKEGVDEYPSHYLKKLLHESECPVIIAPQRFEQIDEIVFTYDGSKASVHAIRQFINLFPELKAKKATVLEIRTDHEQNVDEHHRLKEWLSLYYNKLNFVSLEGDSKNRLLEYFLSHQNIFAVMGGFSRNRWSRILQPSTSAPVVKLLPIPLFIAHP